MTAEGKVYACGEATNGRLGLGLSSGTIPIPRQVGALSSYVVKKVAVHSGGRHAMALTVDGKVFSWGEGDDGELGHFSRMYASLPVSAPTHRPQPFQNHNNRIRIRSTCIVLFFKHSKDTAG